MHTPKETSTTFSFDGEDYQITRDELIDIVVQIWNTDPTIVSQAVYVALGLKESRASALN